MAIRKSGSKSALVIILLLIVLLGFYYLITNDSRNTAGDWPSANQNFSNTREAVNSSIVSDNVTSMGEAWSFPIVGVSEWGAATTNPLIIGNAVYFEDLKSNVYAVDLTSGKQIWIKEYNLDNAGPNGVSVDSGKIFAIKGRYNVVGLNLKGEELWTTNLSENTNEGIDIQTTAYKGLVYVSTVPGVSNENFYKGGSTGIIYALDQNTGKIKWSFDTVDSKDIWGNKAINSGGGAWYPPAIDTAKNILYWGVGNPAPWPGTKDYPNGTSRLGKNLYTNSLVALEQKTGKLLWYNQVLPHDLFDFDLQISPILSSVNINGRIKDIIIGAGKMGRVYGFDKNTGEKIWEASVGTHLNDTLKVLPSGVTKVSPGPLGGVETPMAYSDGTVYVPVVNMEVQYTPSEFVAKSFNLGNAKGELVALNATNGNILWSSSFNSMNVGAATVVNNLVFTTTLDGMIFAFDKITGSKVWEYQAKGGINGWPAVKGDTIIFPVGMGKEPAMVAFRLNTKTNNSTNIISPMSGSGKSFSQ
jgi:glucose dehydrogenase